MRFDSRDGGADFATVTRFKRESRIAYLGFIYRFGHVAESRLQRRPNADKSSDD